MFNQMSKGMLSKDQKVQSVVNLADKEGKTPLMEAAEMGHFNCLKALIEFGWDVNKRCFLGFTALMCHVRQRGWAPQLRTILTEQWCPNRFGPWTPSSLPPHWVF